MDRDQLERWLEDGLSLAQIGERVGRHPSTVGYWCRKLGLAPNGRAKHAPRGGLPFDELNALARAGRTLSEIADQFDVSSHTVRYWLDRYDIPRPIAIRRTTTEEAIRAGKRTLSGTCSTHGRPCS